MIASAPPIADLVPLSSEIPVPAEIVPVATFAKVFTPEKYGMFPTTAAVEVDRPPNESVSPERITGHVAARLVSPEMSTEVPRVEVIEDAAPRAEKLVQDTPSVQETVVVPTPYTPAPPFETRRLLEAGWEVVARPVKSNTPAVYLIGAVAESEPSVMKLASFVKSLRVMSVRSRSAAFMSSMSITQLDPPRTTPGVPAEVSGAFIVMDEVAISPNFAGVPEVVVQYGTRPAVSLVEVLTVPEPPPALMTMVLLFVVVDRVMLEPAERELKRRMPVSSES